MIDCICAVKASTLSLHKVNLGPGVSARVCVARGPPIIPSNPPLPETNPDSHTDTSALNESVPRRNRGIGGATPAAPSLGQSVREVEKLKNNLRETYRITLSEVTTCHLVVFGLGVRHTFDEHGLVSRST